MFLQDLSLQQKVDYFMNFSEVYGVNMTMTIMFRKDARLQLHIPEHMLVRTVDEIGLPINLYNCLRRNDVETIDELVMVLRKKQKLKGVRPARMSAYRSALLTYWWSNITTSEKRSFANYVCMANECMLYIEDGEDG